MQQMVLIVALVAGIPIVSAAPMTPSLAVLSMVLQGHEWFGGGSVGGLPTGVGLHSADTACTLVPPASCQKPIQQLNTCLPISAPYALKA